MRRREFLLATVGAAAFPASVRAQSTKPRGGAAIIAFLTNATEPEADLQTLGPFRRALTDLGLVAGTHYVVEARYGRGDAAKLPALAKELVALGPDLIVVGDPTTLVAAHDVTQTVPTIGQLGSNLPGSATDQMIVNMSRPSGNVTGIITNFGALTGKHVELALEILPAAKNIGVLVYPLAPDGGSGTRTGAQAVLDAHKVRGIMVDVAQPTELGTAFKSLAAQKVEVIVVGAGPVFASDRPRTVQAAAAAAVPTIWNEQGYVGEGGLLSYGFSLDATFIRLASFAQLILKGVPISQIPVEETSVYFMAVNLKTAREQGVTIPQSVLLRANQVIG